MCSIIGQQKLARVYARHTKFQVLEDKPLSNLPTSEGQFAWDFLGLAVEVPHIKQVKPSSAHSACQVVTRIDALTGFVRRNGAARGNHC